MATIALLVALQVTFRYAVQAPLTWSEELTTLCYQWVSYLGAALAVRWRGHYGIDIVVRHVGGAGQAWLRRVQHAVVAVLGAFMVLYGARLVEATLAQTYPTLGMSVGIGYLVLPIAGALFLLMDVAVWLDEHRG